ncbi:MAG: FKBP-type peptidyl-prolyl cis-trans isomerase [Myxococcales bacterium]|nr:FKBP-type peptidyl-prolyl cis-trans isomerase [Myxococcales bacterium]
MKITAGSIVRVEFELRVKGGDVIESSAKSGPVQYVHGEGKLLPALEKRLEGLSAGQSLEGEIPAAEVIPPEDTLPTRNIPRAEFPKDVAVEKGAMFEAHNVAGAVINLKVIAIDDKHVTVRLLPPLAGKDLVFKVKVVMIEDPVSHLREVVLKHPPPLPAEALKIELEPVDD